MKEPPVSVVWTDEVPLPTSVIVTVAPGTAAPCWSFTVPTMVPVVTCAWARVVRRIDAGSSEREDDRRAGFRRFGMGHEGPPLPYSGPLRPVRSRGTMRMAMEAAGDCRIHRATHLVRLFE